MASLCRNLRSFQLFNKQLTQGVNPLLVPIQIRTKKLNPPKPIKRLPEWLPKPQREPFEEYFTTENREFLDRYKSLQMITMAQSPLRRVGFSETPWTPKSKRTGLIAKKIGIYPLWLKTGKPIITTLLQICDLQVVKYIPPGVYVPKIKPKHLSDKAGCLLLGAENTDPELLTEEYLEIFEKVGVPPKKHLMRFHITPDAALPSGTRLYASHFRPGDVVDIRAKTIDRGFQGVMKRWGFHGMPASHGVTKTHRRPGNIGSGSERARVVPGTKLPGHMGNRWRLTRGLRILRVNTEYNVLWVTGRAIPGEPNTYCYVYDTILPAKKIQNPPFPTYFPVTDSSEETDLYADDVHRFDDATITYGADS